MRDSQYRVLIVDDIPDWRATVAGLIKDEGYLVNTAGGYDEALATFKTYPADLAILDIRLIDIDDANESGLDLASALREINPNLNIIMITGYGTVERVERALKKGVNVAAEFIPKSHDTADKIIDAVKKFFRNTE